MTLRSPAVSVHRLALAVALGCASSTAFADASLGPDLIARMQSALPGDELQVVVSYAQSGPLNALQIAELQALGIERAVTMRALPIAGALATPAEISALAQRDDVVSIVPNSPLRYFNREARQITGAARAVENQADFGRAIPYSGAGVTVLVNDSGIDATHEDLKFGEHVVQNVLGPQNILAEIAAEDAPGIVPVTYIENVPNTDLGSGHGTHCAGSVGGTGERSGGLHRGVAPGADLVGYGSGAVILILDAVGGLDYAAINQFSFNSPIRVTSNSWGSSGAFDPTNPVNIATYELYKRGIVSVFAAGNDGPGEDTHNPYAQAPWVISVGAGEKDGVLTGFSSRGKRGESASFTMPDGARWTYYNQPTLVAPGVDIVSVRDTTGSLPLLASQQDVAALAPAHVPFYTHMSGTSMATPHVAGIVALMFEANPNLTPAAVKDILERTATNMSGRLAWEAGVGHVNAYAALAEASGKRSDFGDTVNSLRSFHANALLAPGAAPIPFSIDFTPVGTVPEQTFTVGPEVAWVKATADTTSTVAVVLTDPNGNRYGSAIGIPVPIAGNDGHITTGGPGVAGTWRVTVRGIGSVSGTGLDPLRVTNGYAAPGTVSGEISFTNSGGYTGMSDVANHPARTAIEYAVANRLVDGYSDSKFRPDAALKRSELAQYLLMGTSVRQHLPLSGVRSFTDVALSDPAYGYAEAAVAAGAPLRDLSQQHDGVMKLSSGKFLPSGGVNRTDLAYALVQSAGLQAEARAFSGSLTAFYNGTRVAVDDAGSIPAAMRGYVQLALDRGLINARFTLTQGPFDLQPTVHAWFDPNLAVTRAAYAVAAGRYLGYYLLASD